MRLSHARKNSELYCYRHFHDCGRQSEMNVMGCASSCEMEATSSPIVLTRLVCASCEPVTRIEHTEPSQCMTGAKGRDRLCVFDTVTAASLVANEEELQLDLHLPIRPAVRCSYIVEELCSGIQWLLPNPKESACTATDWNSPAFAPLYCPISSDDRSRNHVPPSLKVVKGENVKGHFILMDVVDSSELVVDKSSA
jgi:hypothetical protein